MLQSESRLTEVNLSSHQSPPWAGTRSLLAECSGVEIVWRLRRYEVLVLVGHCTGQGRRGRGGLPQFTNTQTTNKQGNSSNFCIL